MDAITQYEAEQLVEEWKPILKLQDWTIEVDVVEHLANDDESIGESEVISYRFREAIIRIVSHPWETQSTLLGRDPEITLVHEMLHIYTKGFHDLITDGSWEDEHLERFVDTLAQSLVTLKRKHETALDDITKLSAQLLTNA